MEGSARQPDHQWLYLIDEIRGREAQGRKQVRETASEGGRERAAGTTTITLYVYVMYTCTPVTTPDLQSP